MTAPVRPPRGVRRSRTGAVLGGVCAGVARSAGLDPLLLRIVVVAVTVLTGGAGALAYLAAWVLIPREESAPDSALPPGSEQPGPVRHGLPGAGADVRAAWSAAGSDLRSLAAEFRHPAARSGTSATDAEAPDGGTAPAGAETDAETDAETETTTPPGAIPTPRSPFAAVD